jgi:hypothetical protein
MLSLWLGPGFLWSCTTAPSSLNEAAPSSQQEAATAVLDYRKLAAEFREIAQRREMEAEVLQRQPNPDPAKITHWRDMAERLRKDAEAAEQHARDMQRNIPHGMIQ